MAPIPARAYAALLAALEDPRPFTVASGDEFVDSGGLMEGAGLLASVAALRPESFPPGFERRLFDAARGWSERSETLLDKMMATAVLGQIALARRDSRSNDRWPLLSPDELSLRSALEGEFRYANAQRGEWGEGEWPGWTKPNMSMNLHYGQLMALAERSELESCDYWDTRSDFGPSLWSRVMNPGGDLVFGNFLPVEYVHALGQVNQWLALANARRGGEGRFTEIPCWSLQREPLCLVPNDALAQYGHSPVCQDDEGLR